MFSFNSIVLAIVVSNAEAIWLPFRRSLSEALIAGFEPKTDVTDHSRLDLDQQAIEKYLDGGSLQSFTYAQNVYEKGGFSKSVSSINLDTPLTIALTKGMQITGKSTSDGAVSLKAYADYQSGATQIDVQYISEGCNIGGLSGNSGDHNLGGCLAESGNINIETTSFPYSYSIADDTYNGRTIAGFSTEAGTRMRPDQKSKPYFPDFQKFVNYYGSTDYADKWVTAALEAKETSFSNGNADFSEYDGDYPARAEAAKKGSSYMAVMMYVIRELEDAIYDCTQLCDREECNDDAVHALDEAVAFYTGSLEGSDGDGDGVFMHALADKRAANFKTAGPNGNEASGKSKVNYDVFKEFSLMQDKLEQKDCSGARTNKERIAQLMFVPLVQGAMRYAYITSSDPEAGTKAEAEGATFAAAVLPVVAACNAGDADTIYDNLKVGQGGTADFAEVKEAFENNYGCMGISCADVGGIWDGALGSYEAGAEPCGGASSGNQFGQSMVLILWLTVASLFFF